MLLIDTTREDLFNQTMEGRLARARAFNSLFARLGRLLRPSAMPRKAVACQTCTAAQ